MNILGQKTLTATSLGENVWEELFVVPAKMLFKIEQANAERRHGSRGFVTILTLTIPRLRFKVSVNIITFLGLAPQIISQTVLPLSRTFEKARPKTKQDKQLALV